MLREEAHVTMRIVVIIVGVLATAALIVSFATQDEASCAADIAAAKLKTQVRTAEVDMLREEQELRTAQCAARVEAAEQAADDLSAAAARRHAQQVRLQADRDADYVRNLDYARAQARKAQDACDARVVETATTAAAACTDRLAEARVRDDDRRVACAAAVAAAMRACAVEQP